MNIFTALDLLSSGKNMFFPFATEYHRINNSQKVNADSIITEADKQEIIKKINQASSIEELKTATDLEKVELKFVPDFSPIKFPKYTITNGKANVNLLCEIPGKVFVPECEFNTPISIDGKIFRNYSIIHDGKLNMSTLCVILDDNTYNAFSDAGVKINKSPVIILDLNQFDLNMDIEINTNILFDLECQLYVYKVIQKIYKSYKNSVSNEIHQMYITPEITKFLANHGFKDGVFSPKMIIVEKDKTIIPERQIKVSIKSCSAIPSVSDVQTKLSNNAKLTKSESIMANLMDKTFDMNEIKSQIESVQAQISKRKYAMIMSNQKYNEIIDNTSINGFSFSGLIS